MPKTHSLRLLVTAGPTREKIDPVRFISNMSTGEMGYAIAQAGKEAGFQTTLISGPVEIARPEGIQFISIESASDLVREMLKVWPDIDVLVMAAAVCDYTPDRFSKRKLKRSDGLELSLKPTPDILKFFGDQKENRVLAGFALETDELEKNAYSKLKKKNLDLIVGNLLSTNNQPFGKSKSARVIIYRDGTKEYFKKETKLHFARALIQRILELERS